MLSKANLSSTTNPPTITPQQQNKFHKPNDTNLTNLKQNEVAIPIFTSTTFAQTVPNHNSHPNHNDNTLQNTEEMLVPIATANHTPLPMETPTQAKKTHIPKNPYSTNRNNQQQNQNIQHSHLPSNAYIKKKLKPLILSQHKAFTEFIKDLGNANLTLTKIIENKKESYATLKQNKKNPRSLRIKCTLSTSPKFSTESTFIRLKEKFNNIV